MTVRDHFYHIPIGLASPPLSLMRSTAASTSRAKELSSWALPSCSSSTIYVSWKGTVPIDGLRSMRVTAICNAVRKVEMFAFRALDTAKSGAGILVDIWTRAVVGRGQFGNPSPFSAMTKKRVKLACAPSQVTKATLAAWNTPGSSWIPSWSTNRPSNNVLQIFEHIAAQSGGLWRSACAAAAVDVVFVKETDGKWLAMKVWHWPSAFQVPNN